MSIRHKKRRHSQFRNRPDGPDHRILLADACAEPTQIRAMGFSESSFHEMESPSLDDIDRMREKFTVVWLDLAGLANVDLIQQIGTRYSMHPLALEDVVRTHQRPKIEDYPDSLFIVARMAPCAGQEDTEQMAIFITGNLLISFQEYVGDDLDGIRKRIRAGRGKIRSGKVDYLAYAILDGVIDAYFPLVDRYGEVIESLEDQLVISPTQNLLREIYLIRRKLLGLRRAMWPHREMLATLYRGDTDLIEDSTTVFFRDCYDHTIQLIDLMENYRELASNLMEVYLSSVSNRLNEIMKVLTIISAIFIPLTFIVGVYGMNFHTESSPWNMPELRAYYGYPICMAIMLLIAIFQIVYFARKGWLRSEKTEISALGENTLNADRDDPPNNNPRN